MLIACQKCGAANDEHAQVCYVCDAPYDHPDDEVLVRETPQELASAPEPAAVTVAVHALESDAPTAPEYAPLRLRELEPQPGSQPEAEPAATLAGATPREPAAAFQPEWKREVVHRLEAYRARRRRNGSSDHQSELPFNGDNGDSNHAEPEYRATLRTVAHSAQAGVAAPETPAPEPRRERGDRIEIPVMQPEFNFVLAPGDEENHIHPHAPLVPVAEVRERRLAGLLDLAFLGLSYAGFLVLFRALGGHLSIGKQEAIVYAVTFFLFYALYYGLFTALGGTTPGMYFRGLAVVSFDGEAATARQLLWRSFGYVLSGGTLLLGYVWALWDEDHLTWQDRISQTYITPAPSPMWRDLSGEEHVTISSSHRNGSIPDAT
ncbi:MAG: RDD family protein [Acidobacteria bacterium]|nr:RDD family protein [Acidobacteriota bacterium]